MSDDVTRYTMSVEFDADNVVDPWYAVPEKDSLGSWVRHSDYEALRQRCERLEAGLRKVVALDCYDRSCSLEAQLGCPHACDEALGHIEAAKIASDALKEPTDG